MTTDTSFITNESKGQIDRYLDEICSAPEFLCSNKDLCGSSTTLYASPENVNKICNEMKQSNKCDHEINECLVNTRNLLDESQSNITTSFVNIIIPIPGAFDKNANQKFLRLPALSSSKKPKSQEVCNICACMNRFSTAPGAGKSIGASSYTSPGQNTCIYPDFIEHYYYPINVENINSKLKDKTPPIKLGKYNIVNSNIIYAHSEEQLLVSNLYDLLIKNQITNKTAISFILDNLYKHEPSKRKELGLYILQKTRKTKNLINKGMFYENITFFYLIFTLFVLFLVLKIV
jgi:hypothetical protein